MRYDLALDKLLTTIVDSMGYEYVGSQSLSQGRYSTLRIYIDGEKGVNIDDCAEVSRQLNAVLAVERPSLSEYTLEVSSPGLERPLFTLAHFGRFVGKQVRIRLASPLGEQRNFNGVIESVTDTHVVILCEEQVYRWQLNEIEKANLVADFNGLRQEK